MDNTKIPNTEGLKAHAQNKKESTIKKVDATIQKLIKNKDRINFNSVSMESGVSKAYLYNNQGIRERIETLRKQQEGLSSPKQEKRQMTDASKDVLIAAKNKRIKELEAENKRLKDDLMRLRGKLYDNV
ncbi:MAG: DUF6262 family protein [Ruminiclostridium sp.]